MQLGEVCLVRSGLTLRERLSEQRQGGTLAVQQGDLSPRGEFDRDNAVRIAAPDYSLHRIAPGELVFRSRGPYWSAWAPVDIDEPIVAIAPLFILRPAADIDPAFLAWLIGCPRAQSYFAAEAMGTGVKMITKSVLERLPVEFPPVAVQRTVVEANALGERERTLGAHLNDLRHSLLITQLDRAARLATVTGGSAGTEDRPSQHTEPDRTTR